MFKMVLHHSTTFFYLGVLHFLKFPLSRFKQIFQAFIQVNYLKKKKNIESSYSSRLNMMELIISSFGRLI